MRGGVLHDRQGVTAGRQEVEEEGVIEEPGDKKISGQQFVSDFQVRHVEHNSVHTIISIGNSITKLKIQNNPFAKAFRTAW